MGTHVFQVEISQNDIDHMGHVNNAVYLRWVQDAVVEYWEKAAPPEAVVKHLWVALKHEIEYCRPTFLGDNVIAECISDSISGVRAHFITVIRRGEETLASVRSTWCCLDASTRRPVRLAREISDCLFA